MKKKLGITLQPLEVWNYHPEVPYITCFVIEEPIKLDLMDLVDSIHSISDLRIWAHPPRANAGQALAGRGSV